MTTTPHSIKDFESAIAELEKIVKQLEDGDLPLDTSLAAFRLFAKEVLPHIR